MKARLRKLVSTLGDTFWVIPGLIVLAGILMAIGLVSLDKSGLVPPPVLDSPWLYNGGGTGARTLLGAIVSSTIGVAGTVFSITIAALSLAAGQMGPRLLRNFTKDRLNQVTLGIYLGTFSYALMVLRSVRTVSEGEFVPHVSLSVGIMLAFVCVGMLVVFVNHMAGRINVDTVVELVARDMAAALERLGSDEPGQPPPPAEAWKTAEPVIDTRRGYLQELDDHGLASWAAEHGTLIRLLVRPGDYVFPGAPVAFVASPVEDVQGAVENATALGSQRVSSADLEYTLRQLVEVGVRALSPGINDPLTAISVLERFGAALCDLVPRHLPTGVTMRDGKPTLVIPAIDYDGLTDSMFHMIRQNATSSAAVLIRMLEILTTVAACEREPSRLRSLQRHAALILADGARSIGSPADVDDLRERHWRFGLVYRHGVMALAPGGEANTPA